MLDPDDISHAIYAFIETANFKVEESALTGVPVLKEAIYHRFMQSDEQVPLGDQKNMAFMSILLNIRKRRGVALLKLE